MRSETCGEQLADRAEKALTARGTDESKKMLEILETQKKRIESTSTKQAAETQLRFDWSGEEQRQLEADKRHWVRRLAQIETELKEEPKRIRDVYEVKARRIEPVGLVYLWPVSG